MKKRGRQRSDEPGAKDAGGQAWPRPRTPSLSARAMYRLHRFLEPNALYAKLAARLEATPWLYKIFTRAEEGVKGAAFGCEMCGQCALPATGYACPMSCPKQLRNGPCGGVSQSGACEVYPEMRCVWLVAYERAEAEGHAGDLALLQRPIDHRQWGQSSWVNYWQGRDEGLWTDDGGLAAPPSILRDDEVAAR
ncbi:MAG: methylenetetrahydrofolate reductase C-terminal domain-containing protein [Streptosporangiaceae bacterium]